MPSTHTTRRRRRHGGGSGSGSHKGGAAWRLSWPSHEYRDVMTLFGVLRAAMSVLESDASMVGPVYLPRADLHLLESVITHLDRHVHDGHETLTATMQAVHDGLQVWRTRYAQRVPAEEADPALGGFVLQLTGRRAGRLVPLAAAPAAPVAMPTEALNATNVAPAVRVAAATKSVTRRAPRRNPEVAAAKAAAQRQVGARMVEAYAKALAQRGVPTAGAEELKAAVLAGTVTDARKALFDYLNEVLLEEAKKVGHDDVMWDALGLVTHHVGSDAPPQLRYRIPLPVLRLLVAVLRGRADAEAIGRWFENHAVEQRVAKNSRAARRAAAPGPAPAPSSNNGNGNRNSNRNRNRNSNSNSNSNSNNNNGNGGRGF